jgi:kynurenine formamidase
MLANYIKTSFRNLMCDLGKVPVSEGMEFNAVPIKIKNFTAFPVRAFVTW